MRKRMYSKKDCQKDDFTAYALLVHDNRKPAEREFYFKT